MTEKGRIQRSKFTNGNGDKAHEEKDGQLYVYEYTLGIRNDTTCKRFRTKVYNIKQEGPEGKTHKSQPK